MIIHVCMYTIGHFVEDGVGRHTLAASARQVWLMSRDHFPQYHTKTVHITTWSVVGACGERGREGRRGKEEGEGMVREREREGGEGVTLTPV